MDVKTIARFRAKVDRRGPNDCWPWRGMCNRKGYGQLRGPGGRRSRYLPAHRIAFYLEHGRWPEPCGLHRCDNPPCCNPAHIFEGTRADNIADMIAKGRARKSSGDRHWARAQPHRVLRGERHGRAKLSRAAVSWIRSCNTSSGELALAYGVTPAAIRHVRNGRNWRDA